MAALTHLRFACVTLLLIGALTSCASGGRGLFPDKYVRVEEPDPDDRDQRPAQVHSTSRNPQTGPKFNGLPPATSKFSYLYTVQKPEETLSYICREFYGDENFWKFVYDVNRLSSVKLEPGQKIYLPYFGFTYIVQENETLEDISKKFYGTMAMDGVLAEVNRLETDILQVGQKLLIPIFNVQRMGGPQAIASGEVEPTQAPDSSSSSSTPTSKRKR